MGTNLNVKSAVVAYRQTVRDIYDTTTIVFSHQARPFLRLFCLFSIRIAVSGKTLRPGKSDCKLRLHKVYLTYFVKRRECKLTRKALANITWFQFFKASPSTKRLSSSVSTLWCTILRSTCLDTPMSIRNSIENQQQLL